MYPPLPTDRGINFFTSTIFTKTSLRYGNVRMYIYVGGNCRGRSIIYVISVEQCHKHANPDLSDNIKNTKLIN